MDKTNAAVAHLEVELEKMKVTSAIEQKKMKVTSEIVENLSKSKQMEVPKRSVTAAEAYHAAEASNRVHHACVEFDQFLMGLVSESKAVVQEKDGKELGLWFVDGGKDSALKKFVSVQHANEKDIVDSDNINRVLTPGTQSCFTNAINKMCYDMKSHIDKTHKSELKIKLHRKSAVTGVNQFNKAATQFTVFCVPVDGHDIASFLTRRPDNVFYVHWTDRSVDGIVFIGDNKAHYGKYFTAAHIGELRDFGIVLMSLQRERRFLILFLTNTRGFQFFRLTRLGDGCDYDWEESKYYDGVKQVQMGWQVKRDQFSSQ